jgi:phenol 2-monooxygenase
MIRSDIDGAIDFVRREGNLIRMYVELNKGAEWKDLDRDSITPQLIIEKCQYMLRPYKVGLHITYWQITRLTRVPT